MGARSGIRAGLVAIVLAFSAATAHAQGVSPVDTAVPAQANPFPPEYKNGEVWPLTLLNGVDFAEPVFPIVAAEHGDVGRIVLGSALPYALLVSAFAAKDWDVPTYVEISRPGWNWAGIDKSQDNYPVLYALTAIGGLSLFLPAPDEDQGGYSITLRLDRLTVFVAGVALANAEVELLRPVFDRTRPDGSHGGSRPSGHAATAFASMAFLSDILRDTLRPQDEANPGLRILEETTTALPYLGGFYMALERVHGAKHFLSDTLLGGALGVFTMQMLYEWSFLRVELGQSWTKGFDVAYETGGARLEWTYRF
jgi:membrane-associated phospholipid phosphatase